MMELPYQEGRINFIIFIYTSFSQALTGGLIALHRLAYELAVRNHNVYIFCQPEFPHENIKVINSNYINNDDGSYSITWDGFVFPFKNTVSIYPQITRYNPIQTKHVVRWILYDTEEEIESTYEDSDVYFNFLNFKTFKSKEERKLSILTYFFDIFKKTNFGHRKKFCHILHKHTPPEGEKILEYLNSDSLNGWKQQGGHNYLASKLNEYEYLLTFDQVSFYSTIAVLCGTKVIILTNGNRYEKKPNAYTNSEESKKIMSPTEYRLKYPINMFGVAYGFNDLSWADKTIDLAKEFIVEMEKMETKTVDKFVDYWTTKIFNTYD